MFLANLGFLTLPLYSLCVQMGGDFKAQLLSPEIVHNAMRAHSFKVSNRSTAPLLKRLYGLIEYICIPSNA